MTERIQSREMDETNFMYIKYNLFQLQELQCNMINLDVTYLVIILNICISLVISCCIIITKIIFNNLLFSREYKYDL